LMKKIFCIFIALALLVLIPSTTLAIYDPTSVSNNKFGIHIENSSDLQDAAHLVNSTGGDWGYITLVIQKNQRDINTWQKVFDQARRAHLIPIVRIATQGVGDGSTWEKPSTDEIDGWISFFDSLNWVIKNRYIIIGNEPNQAKEWGGFVNPKEYGEYLIVISSKLKADNPDYFVLPAGFDASAPNSKDTMDEATFLSNMLKDVPDALKYVDGWSSHSYPNPNFTGSETDTGRGSISTYKWELGLLSSLGVNKELPIFITETGWAHTTDDPKTRAFLNPDSLGDKFKYAFENVWNDKRVVAVTPFILSYTDGLFAQFSWKQSAGKFYKFYDDVATLTKPSGRPQQETSGEIMALFIPPFLGSNQTFWGIALAKNTGQSIWKNGELSLMLDNKNIDLQIPIFGETEPRRTGILFFRGTSPKNSGFFVGSLRLAKDSKVFTNAVQFQMITLEKPDFWIIIDELRKIISLSIPRNGKIA